MLGRGRYELSTTGFDENLQLVGGDPYGSSYALGMRVPNTRLTPNNRYLFLLASARIGPNQRVRLCGIRQLLTIGTAQDDGGGRSYPFEQQVTSPWWKFPDGNVSWHLKRVAPGMNAQPHPSNGIFQQSYQYAQQSSILFQVPGTYLGFGSYVAPYQGIPPGASLIPEYDGFRDIRAPWQTPIPIGIDIDGPCDIAMFASVQQSDPGTRPTGVAPGTYGPLVTTGLAPEDAFVANYPSAVYYRIGASLIFEDLPSYTEMRAPEPNGPKYVDPLNGPYEPWMDEPR